MIAITRDPSWAERLDRLASRGDWPFAATDALPVVRGSGQVERAVIILDLALCGSSPSRAIRGLRALFPGAKVLLACADGELGADGVAAGVVSGADDVIAKSWSDEKVGARIVAFRDADAAGERVSRDGDLKVERRSRRARVRARGRWSELTLAAAEFSLLTALITREGENVSREALLAAVARELGREIELETVARRILSLRRGLGAWKGRITTVRGGFYRLESARRRSKT